jgi:3-oxoadipate enol-lactonase
MEMLARDALAIMDRLGLKKVNWCGLSMGGMEGMWLGANAGDRLDKLVLSNCTAYYADKTPWNDRIKFLREKGLSAMVGANLERWFTKDFRARAPEVMARMTDLFLSTPPEGYIACGEAVRDMDHRDLLSRIRVPTLVIAGRQDPATTVEAAEFIKGQIPGARLVVLEAAHISNVERPREFAEAVLKFLAQG